MITVMFLLFYPPQYTVRAVPVVSKWEACQAVEKDHDVRVFQVLWWKMWEPRVRGKNQDPIFAEIKLNCSAVERKP